MVLPLRFTGHKKIATILSLLTTIADSAAGSTATKS